MSQTYVPGVQSELSNISCLDAIAFQVIDELTTEYESLDLKATFEKSSFSYTLRVD